MILVLFALASTKRLLMKETADVMSVVCYRLTTLSRHKRKTVSRLRVFESYHVTAYGSVWRKEVVNQCLGCVTWSVLCQGYAYSCKK